MTFEEVREIIIPVALATRAEFDPPTQRAYARVLKDVAPGICQQALEQLMQSGEMYLPPAPKILHASERLRRALVAARPWTACVDCEDWPGMRKVLSADGRQETRAKCPCKARHRDLLASEGLLEPYAELPSEAGAGDEHVYPTVDQLPPGLRKQIEQVAGRKALR